MSRRTAYGFDGHVFLFVCWWPQLAARFNKKEELGYRFAEGDIMWTLVNVRIMPVIGFLCGIGAGALGMSPHTRHIAHAMIDGSHEVFCTKR